MKYNTLASILIGQEATIVNITSNESMSQRLQEIGFIPGTPVRLVAKIPFGGSLAFDIRGSIVALRRADAACIEVKNV